MDATDNVRTRFSCPFVILFDLGASHDFMSFTCAKKAKLSLVASGVPNVTSTPGGQLMPAK
jgi:hypothetical protein